MAFKRFKTDSCNNMQYGDRTYLERLSKDLNKYPSVRDTLIGLNNKILLKKSYIEKLAIVKSNFEAFLLSLGITFLYFYSTMLYLQQVQVQRNLIKIILLIGILNYYVLPLFFIVFKESKNSVRSKFKIVKKNNKKKEKKAKSSNKEKIAMTSDKKYDDVIDPSFIDKMISETTEPELVA